MTGQAELLAWLQKHPGWHSVPDLMKAGMTRTGEALGNLLRSGNIEKRRLSGRPTEWRAI